MTESPSTGPVGRVVGTEDSTPEDLEAFMQGYVPTLKSLGERDTFVTSALARVNRGGR